MSEAQRIELGPEGTSCEPNLPGVWGAGLAQRSEPERSDGERSGARPTPAPTGVTAPGLPGAEAPPIPVPEVVADASVHPSATPDVARYLAAQRFAGR